MLILRSVQTRTHQTFHTYLLNNEAALMRTLLANLGSSLEACTVEFAIPFGSSGLSTRKQILTRHDDFMQKLGGRKETKILLCGLEAVQIATGEKYRSLYDIQGRSWMVNINHRDIRMTACFDPAEVIKSPDLFPDFLLSVRKFVSGEYPKPLPKMDTRIVRDVETLLAELASIPANIPVVCDTETTGLDEHTDSLIAIGLAWRIPGAESRYKSLIIPKNFVYFPAVIYELTSFFMLHQHFIFHNAKFDLKWLYHYFGRSFSDFQLQIEDTMLMHYTLDPRVSHRSGGIHGLKALARMYLDAESYAIDFSKFLKLPEEQRDYESLYQYLAKDCLYTGLLFEIFSQNLDVESHGPYRMILLPAVQALAEIETRGVLIDTEYLKTLHTEYAKQIADIRKTLCGMVSEFNPTYNPGSVMQTLKILGDFYGMDGIKTTNFDMIQAIANQLGDKPVGIFCTALLRYRELTKIQSTYVSRLMKQPRVYSNFNLHGTVTGRLSSSNPNLQNIPHAFGAAIRKAFTVPEGYTFVNADYSQLEIRVAASLSQDVVIIDAYKNKRDIHQETAVKIFKVDPMAVTKTLRTAAKRIVFGILYGVTAFGLRRVMLEEGIEISMAEAQEFISNFLSAFPGYAAWRKAIENKFYRDQALTSIFGRTRYWPYLDHYNQHAALREAINMPVQSTASDLCLKALIALHTKLRLYGARILFTVHDSIAFEVPTDKLEPVVALIRETMTTIWPESLVPLDVEIQTGSRWEENVES